MFSIVARNELEEVNARIEFSSQFREDLLKNGVELESGSAMNVKFKAMKPDQFEKLLECFSTFLARDHYIIYENANDTIAGANEPEYYIQTLREHFKIKSNKSEKDDVVIVSEDDDDNIKIK